MTDHFPRCVAFVLQREGGYVNHPNDRGGATNLGITQRTYDAFRQEFPEATKDWDPNVKGITQEAAETIYGTIYWFRGRCDFLGWPLCLVHFDACVNAGLGNARRFLSRCNGRWEAYLELRRAHYERLIAKDGSQEVFRKGWMNRLKHVEIECKKANDPSLT